MDLVVDEMHAGHRRAHVARVEAPPDPAIAADHPAPPSCCRCTASRRRGARSRRTDAMHAPPRRRDDDRRRHRRRRLASCRAVPCGVDIASTRAMESMVALDRLGCGSVHGHATGPSRRGGGDRDAPSHEALSDLLGPDDLCLTPWRCDGHPDHDATGKAALAAAGATGTPVLEYLVWTWHWATPDNPVVPWRHCRRLDLDRRQRHGSAGPPTPSPRRSGRRDSESRRGPVLTDSVLRRFWRPFEVFIEADG